jgi:hypothetical protein
LRVYPNNFILIPLNVRNTNSHPKFLFLLGAAP